MPTVGAILVPTLTVDPFGDDTAATLQLEDPDGDRVPLSVSTADGGNTWTAGEVRFAAGGRWWLLWHVEGTGGPGDAELPVDVDDPQPEPVGFSHATTGDYTRHTGLAPDDDTWRQLVAASREIDRATRLAVYATDPVTGRAADPAVAAALAEATCELVTWWQETGLQTGSRALVSSASIGGVSLGFAGGGGAQRNPQADRIGPAVWTILIDSGLVGHRPRHAGGVVDLIRWRP